MQKINFLTLSTIASLVLIGCGGSSTSTTSSTNTGTGYYTSPKPTTSSKSILVENFFKSSDYVEPIEGINYICGTETGKTDKDGTFTFEKGKECKFSLAGVPLRTTSADKLTDGERILESDIKVLRFLESIDANNNLVDGIQITDEVLTALTNALETLNSTGTLPEGTVLTEVVASVGHDVTDVSGEVRTDEQVQAHLTQTQTEITKELLAGKTFYVAYNENGIDTIEKHVINNDVTQSSWSQIYGQNNSGTANLTVDGNKVTFHSDDGDHVISIESMDSKYIYLTGEKKLYLNFEDAKKSFEEASLDGNGGDSSNGSELETLVLKSTYEIPYIGRLNRNVILDGDALIFIGGEKASAIGAQHDGHPAFFNKAIKINLITGDKKTLDINASTGHPYGNGTVANGRGNSAIVYKLDTDKYIVYGGFQYVKNIEIVDFVNESVESIDTDLQITDTEYQGLNTTPFFTNNQASVMVENGDVYFFGFNNGLYGMKEIARFSYQDKNFALVDANLTMSRSQATAHILADGRIIIIGGWYGTADVGIDSATRRVEIFDPNDNSIIRVSNYPEPISNGQITEEVPTKNDKICVGKYQYTISQDSWESGCSINKITDEFNSFNYNFPVEQLNTGIDDYLGTLSNGDIIFFKNGEYSSTFSDELKGYPVKTPTKIYGFSKK